MSKNQKYITDERKFIIFFLKLERGYTNAEISRILFNTSESNITRFLSTHHNEIQEYVKNLGA